MSERVRLEEVNQDLRTLAALSEDLFPACPQHPCVGTQLSVTNSRGHDLMTSSGLCEYQAPKWDTDTQICGWYIHAQKIKFENKRASLPGTPDFCMHMGSRGWLQFVYRYFRAFLWIFDTLPYPEVW